MVKILGREGGNHILMVGNGNGGGGGERAKAPLKLITEINSVLFM